jgi:hypothetical protein
MTPKQIIELRRASARAYSELTFPAFCQKVGMREDMYTEELWQAFHQFHKGLCRFDAKTLARLLAE